MDMSSVVKVSTELAMYEKSKDKKMLGFAVYLVT